MSAISVLSLLLIIIGAINWGLWGFFQFDLVAWLLDGNTTPLSRVVYSIIGLAGVWSLRFICKCKHLCCHSKKCGCGSSSCCCNKNRCACGKDPCICNKSSSDHTHGGGCCKM